MSFLSELPVGFIMTWPNATNPEGYDEYFLDCDGRTIQAADYPELVRVLAGDEATECRVPNYGGLFLRGYGSQQHTQQNGILNGVTVTTHASGELGEVQGDAIRNISGSIPLGNTNGHTSNLALTGAFAVDEYDGAYGPSAWDRDNVRVSFNASLVVPTASEDRPANTAVRYMIKAR